MTQTATAETNNFYQETVAQARKTNTVKEVVLVR